MPKRIANKHDESGFSGAIRYIAENSAASLAISAFIVVTIYLLDKNSEFIASLVHINSGTG